MDTPFIGTIVLFAGNFAPKNWAFCNGQLLPISQNTALFSILGAIYGGDGKTTFALPDLRSRVPLGAGQGNNLSSYQVGQTGGSEEVTLTLNQIPMHTHQMIVANTDANLNSPANAFLANANGSYGGDAITLNNYVATATNPTSLNPQAIQPVGGNLPHENRQPYLAMNYIIALYGLYPPRP